MTLHVAERIGAQRPRLSHLAPGRVSSAGQEAVDLAASVGLILDPWQQWCLDHALAERADGKWSAFEAAIVVGRQNGKGSILEARELAGLFLFEERLIVHSAHLVETALEHFNRLLALIEASDDLMRKVKKVWQANGRQSITLRNGCRLKISARAGGNARGFTGDTIVFDEAYDLPAQAIGAMVPTLSARPNPQVLYTSSAAHLSSTVLRSLRRRALEGDPEARLFYAEWSAEPTAALHDREAWYQANPALGIRIPEEFLADELRLMADMPTEFARERLGIPDDETSAAVIPSHLWAAATAVDVSPSAPLTLAVDATPERTFTAIAVVDGEGRGELIEHRAGTAWVVDRVAEIAKKHSAPVALDSTGPLSGLVPDLEHAGVTVVKIPAGDVYSACGSFVDGFESLRWAIRSHPSLTDAVRTAQRSVSGDRWRFTRKGAAGDISPLMALTLALWAARTAKPAAIPWAAWG